MNSKVSNLPSGTGFWALFCTQFLGAFNDNLVKSAVVIGVTFNDELASGYPPEQLALASAALFIAPFFLFSALAGQLADKYRKTTIARWVKVSEVVIMLVTGLGLVTSQLWLALCGITLMGTHSAVFGPVKYGLLPELLQARQLVAGNAWIELGTFLAILSGTLLAGGLTALGTSGILAISAIAVCAALAGLSSARQIPETRAAAPNLKIDRGIVRPTLELLRMAQKPVGRWYAVLGISWFWLLGAVILSELPSFVKVRFGGHESLTTALLTIFSLGIGAGSLLCERLSHKRVELGLVPLGALGMALALFDAAWASSLVPSHAGAELATFFADPNGLRFACDLFLCAVASGSYIVPLYAFLQQRSAAEERARIVAANNVMNAAFMAAGTLLLMVAHALNASGSAVLAGLGLLTLIVTAVAYGRVPEFLFRFLCYCLARAIYRVRISGRENIPPSGPAVLVCNHVTFVDWLLISAASERPIRFVMHHEFMKVPGFARPLRDAKVIPIAARHQDPELLERAFARIAGELAQGELVCIFPEGKLTLDGEVARFRRGIERIVATTPAPVVPMYLSGLWGSVFSRERPRRFRFARSVALCVGQPMAPEQISAARLEREVIALSGRSSSALRDQGPVGTTSWSGTYVQAEQSARSTYLGR